METNERIAAIAWLGANKARDEGREGDRKTSAGAAGGKNPPGSRLPGRGARGKVKDSFWTSSLGDWLVRATVLKWKSRGSRFRGTERSVWYTLSQRWPCSGASQGGAAQQAVRSMGWGRGCGVEREKPGGCPVGRGQPEVLSISGGCSICV